MSEAETGPGHSPPFPAFEVRLNAPDLGPWLAGNTGVAGFTTLPSGVAGPHVLLLALTHGNEISGAIVLERLLRARLRPARGILSFGFVNLTAFARFDPRQPTLSRFVDEDMNRLWDPAVLEGPRRSCELGRAREILPAIMAADYVLDLHSMLWPADPLILSGPTATGRRMAGWLGMPELVVADSGHASGARLIDHPRFTAPGAVAGAVLVEAGQHWENISVDVAHGAVAGLLRHFGMAAEDVCLPPPRPKLAQRHAEVTHVISAKNAQFVFTEAYRGGTVIARRNTVIALDGEEEIRTPYDNCLLVMPSLRPSRGHTAVRLAQLLTD